MTITALSGLVEQEYIPEDDKDSENPTVFRLKPLNGMQYMEVMSEVKRVGDFLRVSGDGLKLAIKYGLVGWKDFYDENGKDVKFNPHTVLRVPSDVLAELADKIISISRLEGTEIKNS